MNISQQPSPPKTKMHCECFLVQYLVNQKKNYRKGDLVSVKGSGNREEEWKEVRKKRNIPKQEIKRIFDRKVS